MVSQAAMQANGILDNAMIEANEMKAAAVQYTDQLLADVESIIAQSIDATSKHNDEIIESVKQNSINIVKEVAQNNDNILSALTQYSEIIKSNRADLNQPVNTTASAAAAPSDTGEQTGAQGDNINLDILN